MPRSLSSTCPRFTSSLESLFPTMTRPCGVQLTTSNGRPDGACQPMSGDFPALFTHACPKRWSFWIPLAQFCYNSSHHSTIGMSPFKALYGHEPQHWGITADTKSTVPSLQAWLEERQVAQDLIQQHLHRARQCMKTQADKKRSFRSFQVGDRIFLKLQPYI